MWLGSKFTLLSESLFKSLFKVLFRYDIFISYARGDGKEYALKLRDQLKQLDFSCFLDFDELSHRRAPNEIYLWNTNTGRPVACRDDQKAGRSERDPQQTLTFPDDVVCAETEAAEQKVQLSEVRIWKTPLEFNLISNSPDGRWSVNSDKGLKLIFNEGKIPRQVAELVQDSNAVWTFTPNSRWLVIRGGTNAELWPLSITEMIDAACARLRRHELADKEWRFSDKQLQPCSLPQP